MRDYTGNFTADFTNEKNLRDYYASLDISEHSLEDNDKIFMKIKFKFLEAYDAFLQKKRNKQIKKEMYKQYRKKLLAMQEEIQRQIKLLNSVIADDTYDNVCLRELKTHLSGYFSEIDCLDYNVVSQIFDGTEKQIYYFIQIYDCLSECLPIIKSDSMAKMHVFNQETLWKNIFFYTICQVRQNTFDNEIIANYVKRNKPESNELRTVTRNYYVHKYQGEFAKSILTKRKLLKLTQKELQEKSGIDHSMIAKIEKLQQTVTFETAIKLLTSLNMGICIYSVDTCDKL